ncbi:PQQ-binding-like beta-propeller repeat protein [Paenibacillus radicis (ex Xue et al. 2023)]|uniref:PQQ-binding-like beta-propeller repeat protein n=1 Tax=Paenibacillus radicis (ex Xue et al. 2023) TaxID=2972489 RepID=A0ABT1YTQ1_9BACL|nr:PQQ-binding-like beta-propeller repeat protein [Paenibacillus radicis (ex Xue et al. 2023)]MCR8636566.1 PQQ-binding-like beta-propeller repeat protein [Paenibacillus radicis (ex Xue et al. 2023)]
MIRYVAFFLAAWLAIGVFPAGTAWSESGLQSIKDSIVVPDITRIKDIKDFKDIKDVQDLNKIEDIIKQLSPIQLNPKKGTYRWDKLLDNRDGSHYSYTPPAIGADGTLYIGTEGSSLSAISPDGITKWNFAAGGIVVAQAVGTDGTIYAAAGQKLYGVNPDGSKKWELDMKCQLGGSLTVDTDGSMYTGCLTGKFFAIKPDLSIKWSIDWDVKESPWSPSSAKTVEDGTVYVGSGHNLLAMKPNGMKKWETATGGKIHRAPVVGADGTIYTGSEDKNLYALNPDGTVKWTFATGGEIKSSPAIGKDGTLYVASNDKNLYAIHPNGTKKWVFTTKVEHPGINTVIFAPVIGVDGSVYIVTLEGVVYAVNANGSGRWSYNTDYLIGTDPAIGPDGTVYVKTYSEVLYALGTVPVSSVTLNKRELALEIGQKQALTAAVIPNGAANKRVSWESSDPLKAEVDNEGNVTGKSVGAAVITVKTQDGEFVAKCNVTVTGSIAVPTPEPNPVTAPQQGAGQDPFSDINGNWANAAIREAVKRDIAHGYPDGTFLPEGNITRAEFTVMLMNSMNPGKEEAELWFHDTDSIGQWAVQSVSSAVKAGIISGYPDNTFRPGANITHAEMAAMVVKASGLPVEASPVSGYEDYSSIPEWAKGAASTAEKVGIIIVGGLNARKFAPDVFATRAEAASAIVSLQNVMKK